jgi:hypothetical protein
MIFDKIANDLSLILIQFVLNQGVLLCHIIDIVSNIKNNF